MKVYALTQWGRRLARSTRNPDTAPYKVISYLDKVGHATKEQIVSFTGLQESEAGMALSRLRRHNPPLVVEAVGG